MTLQLPKAGSRFLRALSRNIITPEWLPFRGVIMQLILIIVFLDGFYYDGCADYSGYD